jgi:hypothetical protein
LGNPSKKSEWTKVRWSSIALKNFCISDIEPWNPSEEFILSEHST